MLQNRSSSAESGHANTEASVSGHRLYSDGTSCANWDPLLFQNRSSSTESAHAITEASVSGHRLYSDGKSIEFVDGKRNFFSVRMKMTLGIFLSEEKKEGNLE